jgi:hypothetical protein
MLRVITFIGGKRAGKLKERAHRAMTPWLISVGLAAVVFVHTAFLRLTWSRALPTTAIVGVVIVVAVKHLGLIASLLARFRRVPKDGECNADDAHTS